MSETICPDCGERNARGTEFCSACGAFLAWDGQEQAAPEPTPAAPPRPVTAPSTNPQAPPAAANQPPTPRAPAGAPPPGPPAGQPGGQSWRPTQPVVAAGEQIVGQPAARAWNAAAPTFGTQLPGGFNAGSIAREAGTAAGWRPGSGCVARARSRRRTSRATAAGSARLPGAARAATADRGSLSPLRCREQRVVAVLQQCGLALVVRRCTTAGGARNEAPPERLPWWRKIFKPAPNTRRAARAAYRHSLPLR